MNYSEKVASIFSTYDPQTIDAMPRLFSLVTVMSFAGFFVLLGGQFVVGMAMILAANLLWWVAFVGWGIK